MLHISNVYKRLIHLFPLLLKKKKITHQTQENNQKHLDFNNQTVIFAPLKS